MNTNGITINEAIAQSGLSNNYIRKAIMKGDLKVTKELVPGTKNNWRNVILNFNEWRATRSHIKREDGRSKFVLYMNPDEEASLRNMMENDAVLAHLDTLQKAYIKSVEDGEIEAEAE